MVISHDCEFNEGKRAQFLVARIERLPTTTSAPVEDLLAANDLQVAAERGLSVWTDSFVLSPSVEVFGDAHHRRVNFCRVMSLPMKSQSEALTLKKAELEQSERERLRFKLAFFFGRQADDIPDEEKHSPGQEAAAEANPGEGESSEA
jgi:hypothetical protein